MIRSPRSIRALLFLPLALLLFAPKPALADGDVHRVKHVIVIMQENHLTRRDQHASSLEDLFDFDRSPSLHTTLSQAVPPTVDCTPN